MTSCHIEADLYVDGGYMNGIKRIYIEYGDNDEGFMLGPYEARELAEEIENIAGKDPYDPDRSVGRDFYDNGEYLGVYPDGWDVAIRINGIEAIIDRSDAKEIVGDLKAEACE